MKFELLGPVRLVDRAGPHLVSAPKIAVLLGVLLLKHDKIVPCESLVSEIWGAEIPRRANAALHVYVSQLRKALREVGGVQASIVTRRPGYLLQLGDCEYDVGMFQQLAEAGKAHHANGRHDRSVATFDAALRLWRGPFLGDLFGGPIVEGFAAWLGEEMLTCMEQQIDSRMALGEYARLVGLLHSLTIEYPLHEPFHAQLVRTLQCLDRPAEALQAYHRARRMIITELGVEPSAALRGLVPTVLRKAN